MSPMDRLHDRYAVASLHLAPSEVREAAMFAVYLEEESRIPAPIRIKVPT